MPKSFALFIWKEIDLYRGFQLWRANIGEPIYAVRVGMDVKASLNLDDVHEFVDRYWNTKLN